MGSAPLWNAVIAERLTVQPQLFDLAGMDLQAMGRQLAKPDSSIMGGYQAILVQPAPATNPPVRIYRAGSDHRKDGEAVGWQARGAARQLRTAV